MTNTETNTLCPFIGMKPCIGEECVMYLKTDSIEHEGEKIEYNIFLLRYKTPCAIAYAGLKSAFELVLGRTIVGE